MAISLFILLITYIHHATSSTCSSSVPSTYSISTAIDSTAPFSTATFIGVVSGPSSSDLYFMYDLYSGGTDRTALMRKDHTDNQIWMAAFIVKSLSKSLAVDQSEQNVYFAVYSSPAEVIRVSASSGAYVDGQSL